MGIASASVPSGKVCSLLVAVAVARIVLSGRTSPPLPTHAADCPVRFSTTDRLGSTSVDDCVCQIGYYRAPKVMQYANYYKKTLTLRVAGGDDTGPADSSEAEADVEDNAGDQEPDYVCRECSVTHELGSYTDATNCSRTGITLWDLPVSKGYYRRTNTSHFVRKCMVDGVRGPALARPCRQTPRLAVQDWPDGPDVRVCDQEIVPKWHQGSAAGGIPCKQCPEGDMTLEFILPFIVVGVAVSLLLMVSKIANYTSKVLLMSRLPTEVPIRPEQDMDDVWEKEMEKALKALRGDRPRLMLLYDSFKLHSVSVGPRIKILISLFQVLAGIGLVFAIQYPPLYKSLWRQILANLRGHVAQPSVAGTPGVCVRGQFLQHPHVQDRAADGHVLCPRRHRPVADKVLRA